jgi:hypothetical protein
MTATKTKVSIFRDNVWAGDGRLVNGFIEDCPAILGPDQDAAEETYALIESAIADGDTEVVRPDGKYTWTIS